MNETSEKLNQKQERYLAPEYEQEVRNALSRLCAQPDEIDELLKRMNEEYDGENPQDKTVYGAIQFAMMRLYEDNEEWADNCVAKMLEDLGIRKKD